MRDEGLKKCQVAKWPSGQVGATRRRQAAALGHSATWPLGTSSGPHPFSEAYSVPRSTVTTFEIVLIPYGALASSVM
jgi:hypothetical protein